MNKNSNQIEKQAHSKRSITVNFALLSGILILLNSALVGASAELLPGLLPTLPGSTGNDPAVLYTLSVTGLTFGSLVLLGALMLYFKPANRKIWGIMVGVFSVPSIICGGGFIAGVLLGLFAGRSAVKGKSDNLKAKLKLHLPRMTDDSGKMKIEGAGPKIMAPLFVTFIVTAGLSYLYQPTFNYPLAAAPWVCAVGIVFLAAGLLFWLLSVVSFFKAWQQQSLATGGPFAVMLNPIYGSFILFVIPGLSLLLNWWPILLTSVAMYAAHRRFIHEEDDLLREKFGRAYEDYRAKVLIKCM